MLVSSPIIGSVLRLPIGEQFSELFLLDQDHNAKNYPFNLEEGKEYLVYLGVSNHMASSAYYVLKVKLGNQTDPLPNSTIAAPSTLESLYEYKFFVADKESWEAPLTFSIFDIDFVGNRSVINGIVINNVEYTVNKKSEWNTEGAGFYFKLFVELWIFNPQFDSIEFHNRFVALKLNITQTV